MFIVLMVLYIGLSLSIACPERACESFMLRNCVRTDIAGRAIAVMTSTTADTPNCSEICALSANICIGDRDKSGMVRISAHPPERP